MMNNTQSTVIGSNKTSRSCDSCLSKRALWFCAADDAFLCQSCDKSVHSANSLASRHERVRLEKASSSYKAIDDELDPTKNRVSGISVYGSVVPKWMKVVPSIWDQGITKKPRTPRFQKPKKGLIKELNSNLMEVLVPEFDSEETFSPNENEEQLLNRVPVLDLLDVGISSNKSFDIADKDTEFDLDLLLNDHEVSGMNLFLGIMSTDELVIDVENYLSTNIEDDWCGYRGLYGGEGCYEDKRMKVEEESQILETITDFYCDTLIPEDMTRESSNWDFEDYSSSPLVDLEQELKINDKEKEVRRINLKLNHEAIICAWDCQSSPWMNGIKPDFNLNDCWPEFMGNGSTILIDEDPNGSKNRQFGSYGKDEEREARVLRYKEKRRTRLFSKKIRYQVRKLNAEKRPRMKGRFVKRTTAIVGSSLNCCR